MPKFTFLVKRKAQPIHIDRWFYFLVTVLAFWFIVFPLSQRGMFVDGLTYASISRNLAEGLGTFWEPFYTEAVHPKFHEHPPLALGIQSLFFTLFGDRWWVEGMYCMLCWILTAIAMEKISSLWVGKSIPFALITWTVTPLVFWCMTNNVLENTIVVFTLWCTYFLLKGHAENELSERPTKRILRLLTASILLLAAFLTKGFVGLFPLVVPVWLSFFRQGSRKKGVVDFIWLIALTILCFFALSAIQPQLIPSLSAYLEQQFFPALEGNREDTGNGRLWIWGQLLLELSIPWVVFFIFFFQKKVSKLNSNLWVLLFIGLTASLPLALSPKQRAFYLLPSIPYFLLVFQGVLTPVLDSWRKSMQIQLSRPRRESWINGTLQLSVLVGLIILQNHWGDFRRDKDLIADSIAVKEAYPSVTLLKTQPRIETHWSTVAVFMRYASVSLKSNAQTDYFLNPKEAPKPPDSEWEKVEELEVFDLYKAVK